MLTQRLIPDRSRPFLFIARIGNQPSLFRSTAIFSIISKMILLGLFCIIVSIGFHNAGEINPGEADDPFAVFQNIIKQNLAEKLPEKPINLDVVTTDHEPASGILYPLPVREKDLPHEFLLVATCLSSPPFFSTLRIYRWHEGKAFEVGRIEDSALFRTAKSESAGENAGQRCSLYQVLIDSSFTLQSDPTVDSSKNIHFQVEATLVFSTGGRALFAYVDWVWNGHRMEAYRVDYTVDAMHLPRDPMMNKSNIIRIREWLDPWGSDPLKVIKTETENPWLMRLDELWGSFLSMSQEEIISNIGDPSLGKKLYLLLHPTNDAELLRSDEGERIVNAQEVLVLFFWFPDDHRELPDVGIRMKLKSNKWCITAVEEIPDHTEL